MHSVYDIVPLGRMNVIICMIPKRLVIERGKDAKALHSGMFGVVVCGVWGCKLQRKQKPGMVGKID